MTEFHSHDFYKKLPFLPSFADIGKGEAYIPFPKDWYVVITDIIGSTLAIEAGRYKEVNVAGAISTMAISNVADDLEFPFIFGGDGVTFFLPPSMLDIARDVLADTRHMVRQSFDLGLRVGFIEIAELYQAGYRVSVAKVKMSPHYSQASIGGNGLEYAEKLVKTEGSSYLLPLNHKSRQKADFTGFTCRWQDVPSSKGETVALIVKMRGTDDQSQLRQLVEIYQKTDEIFGGEKGYHPLRDDLIQIASSEKYLKNEASVQSDAVGGMAYFFQMMMIKMQILMMRMIIALNLPLKPMGVDVRGLKKNLVLSSDFRKYDGTLKMIVTAARHEREKFEKYLQDLYSQKKIYYGLFVSDRALMTCLMRTRTNQEVHFIDAADGGYAMAAKQLKRQLAGLDT